MYRIFEDRDHFTDQDLDGRILLKKILVKQDALFTWFRIGFSDWTCLPLELMCCHIAFSQPSRLWCWKYSSGYVRGITYKHTRARSRFVCVRGGLSFSETCTSHTRRNSVTSMGKYKNTGHVNSAHVLQICSQLFCIYHYSVTLLLHIYLFIYLLVHLFIILFIYSLICFILFCLFIYSFIYLFVYLFVHLFIRLFIYFSVYLFYLLIRLFIRSYISLFICLFIYSFIYPYIYLFYDHQNLKHIQDVKNGYRI